MKKSSPLRLILNLFIVESILFVFALPLSASVSNESSFLTEMSDFLSNKINIRATIVILLVRIFFWILPMYGIFISSEDTFYIKNVFSLMLLNVVSNLVILFFCSISIMEGNFIQWLYIVSVITTALSPLILWLLPFSRHHIEGMIERSRIKRQ